MWSISAMRGPFWPTWATRSGCLDGDRANEVYRLTRLQMEQAGMHGDRGLYEAIMRLEQRCRVVLLSNSYEETVRGIPAAARLCRSVPRDLQQCEQAPTA